MFPEEGTRYFYVSVTASGNYRICEWTATSNAAWITINSGSSYNGSGKVQYSVLANTDTSSRTGTLTIAEQTYTVTQGGSLPKTETYEFVTQWGGAGNGNGQFQFLVGVAVDSSGNVYVTDTGNNRIQKFNGTGTFITQWGGSGNGNGTFNGPAGVAVDSSGNVYVADQSNNLIQKFKLSSSDINVIADFYATPTAGKAPLKVNFTDLSTGDVASYAWDFGDESAKSTEKNPTHTYAGTGQYSVKLTIVGINGSTDIKIKEGYITVANLADCPIKQTMSDQTLIETLHKLRDERFNGFYGSLLTTVFYKNAPEISFILSRNQALQKTFKQLITDNIGIAEELIANGSATLPEQNAQEIIAFLQDLGKEGSFGLKLYTAFVIKGIEYRFLMRGIGLEVE